MADRVLGSKASALVLALLSSIAGAELHTNEIIRRTGANSRSVQTALEKNERSGLLTSRRVGNLRLWRMDPSNPVYPSVRELFARTRGVPAQLADALRPMRGVKLAFLFGSYVTAMDNPTSDIDLFVVGDLDWAEVGAAARKAGRQVGREVNPIVWSEAEFARPPDASRAFLDTVLAGPIMWLVGDETEIERLRPGVGADLVAGGAERRRVDRRREGSSAKGPGPRSGRKTSAGGR